MCYTTWEPSWGNEDSKTPSDLVFPYQVWWRTESPENSDRAKKMWANSSQLRKLSKVCPFRFCPFPLEEMMLLFCGYWKGTSYMTVSWPASGEGQKVLSRPAFLKFLQLPPIFKAPYWDSVPWTLATSCQVGLFVYMQCVIVCMCVFVGI